MTTTVKRSAIIVGLLIAVSCSSFAFFGMPQWVMDFTEWARTQETTIATWAANSSVIKNIKQTTRAAAGAENILANAKMESQMLRGRQSFAGVFSTLYTTATESQKGETTGWAAAVNHGIGVTAAWQESSMRIAANPVMAATSALAKQYASAEIQQGATKSAIAALGAAKQAQAQMQKPISACEQSATSESQPQNTRAALQGISNVCQSLALRQSQTLAGIEGSRLELDIAQSKEQSDRLVLDLNRDNAIQQYSTGLSMGTPGTTLNSITDR